MKKLLSTLLTLTLLFASSTTTFASEITAPGQATTSAVLTTEAALMNVTLPLAVMIYVDADGNVFTPDNLQIQNNSAGPIQVLSLEVVTDNGWTLDPASTDYTNYKSGLKHFGMTLNGMDPALGVLTFPTPINGGESLLLEFDATVSPQKEALNAVKIGEMVITVDWYSDETGTGDTGTGTETGSYPEGYVMATDADFEGDSDGSFHYIGAAEQIIMPDTIKGIPVTSYRYIFANTAVKGVISENPNITTMEQMFYNASSSTLELDLNTTSTTNMLSMFEGTQATVLDLSSFDTAKVTTMQNMFKNSKATTLDLSSFNTSSVTTMLSMFYGSAATTINLSSFNTSAVTTMQYMFYGSQSLTLDLSSFNTSAVTSMSSMFQNSAATSFNLSSFNTTSVTSMSNMFDGSKVGALDLSGFNTSKVTTMIGMFKNSSATTLNLANFDTSKLISMSSMFEGAKATALDLSSFNTALVTNMQAMFKNSAATTLNLSSFSTYQVTNMSNMFEGSKALVLDLSSFDISSPTTTNMFYNAVATTGYARNSGYATKFNASSNKPAGLVFTVK